MASRQSRKTVQTAPLSESDGEVEQQSSHDQSTVDMVKTAQNMVSAVIITYSKVWRPQFC